MYEDRLIRTFPDAIGHSVGSVLSSRLEVFEEIRNFWVSGRIDQATLTGEPGSGKSWLWRAASEAVREEVKHIRWFWVHQLPGGNAYGLLQSMLMALGGNVPKLKSSPEYVMARVEERIEEIVKDGFRVEIVIEEAHLVSKQGYETVRILQEKLRQRSISVGILYVGQSNLLFRYHQYSGHYQVPRWHLQHLTLHEAIELLNLTRSDFSWTRAEADWIHREALGNPRRIIRWAETWDPEEFKPQQADKPIVKPGISNFHAKNPINIRENHLWNEPLIPVRPPIEESEGCIEVGYSEDEPVTEKDELAGGHESLVKTGMFLTESGTGSRQGETLDETDNEPGQNAPGAKIWSESPSAFAPYGLGSLRKMRSQDQEIEP